jgi:hypothetical protein
MECSRSGGVYYVDRRTRRARGMVGGSALFNDLTGILPGAPTRPFTPDPQALGKGQGPGANRGHRHLEPNTWVHMYLGDPCLALPGSAAPNTALGLPRETYKFGALVGEFRRLSFQPPTRPFASRPCILRLQPSTTGKAASPILHCLAIVNRSFRVSATMLRPPASKWP